ncbi:Gfo/Idh/MocA family oxidoreductase [Sporosarcina thermotolerans]|uniref:Gfo/Idh/MocA family oxidoreductase n=1 Tax=Sporosarcina thermotolerans TaxID=633404 RepID=A0AAW9AA43_9BACL|nr:Gfo/Idh/MocA family oxidoreductase [Sporosarcina thermotolerans]MDW0116548.1 Gfo/Idh/MocA family oxidoreductase [Sporosarcina thermotolerans]WHT48767.1 Gfo/Idh/MocA family oxidoreductase [Sporosarcina thermotolerans]
MIHIGIIGLGAIGQRLINQFKQNDEVTITAVCDRAEALAHETADKLGDVQAYTDHKQLLSNKQVDLVYVAVPPKFHHAIVMDAILAKKHVLCEKPLANSLEEAREMADAAKDANIVHAMNFPLNYGQAATKFAELIQENYVGKLRRLQLSMHFPEWPRAWQKNDWVGEREQGGFVLEVGVHFIQQTLKVFGELHNIKTRLEFPEDRVLCETGIIATAELADGTPVLIEGMSGQAGKEHIGFTAFGSEGVLTLENWGQLSGGKTGHGLQLISLEGVESRRLIDEIVKAVNGQEADLYDFEVGYQAQNILEALRK